MRVLKVLGLALTLVSFVWILLAANAGMFQAHDEQPAVSAGEFTPDTLATRKKNATLKNYTVAYLDEGQGPPLILLHGCPFSTIEWKDVLPELTKHFRVIAPDLNGLGDTPVALNDDYRLPHITAMVRELMDHLGIKSAAFIGHDHGGATVLLLMKDDPSRIEKAILTNIEAYDQWPSKPEIPSLQLIVNPVTSPLFHQAIQWRWFQRETYSVAVHDPKILTDDLLDSFVQEHAATGARWQRLRRFFTWQLDPAHSRLTMEAVPAMRAFDRPVLLLWGGQDTNFGKPLARRLAADIPGTVGVHWLENSAHLPMLEEPAAFAQAAIAFLKDGQVSQSAASELLTARQAQN